MIRAQRLAALESLLHCRPSAERASRQRLLPGSRPRSHGSEGVGELRMVGCTSAAGPKPKPIPGCAETLLLWPGAHADTTEELVCLFLRGRRERVFLSKTFRGG